MSLRRGKGLSLLEVLIAVTILLFSFLFMLGMFPASERGISQARNIFSANQIARDILDYWAENGYTWVVSQPPGAGGVVTVAGQSGGAPQSTTFRWNLLHSPVVSGGVEQVDVVVTWTQSGGIPYQAQVHETAWVNK